MPGPEERERIIAPKVTDDHIEGKMFEYGEMLRRRNKLFNKFGIKEPEGPQGSMSVGLAAEIAEEFEERTMKMKNGFIKLTYFKYDKDYPNKSKSTGKTFWIKTENIEEVTQYDEDGLNTFPSSKITMVSGREITVCDLAEGIINRIGSASA